MKRLEIMLKCWLTLSVGRARGAHYLHVDQPNDQECRPALEGLFRRHADISPWEPNSESSTSIFSILLGEKKCAF
jgi:hypothetical protein